MHLQSISILNFRNIEPFSSGFGKGFWAVLGANGQGKSNLLEAIAMLCSGRSRRTERDRETIRMHETWMSLDGTLEREMRGEARLSVRLTPEGRKELTVFGAPVGRLAKYITEASCVVFSSEDVEIVLGEPTLRRQYINEAVSQASHGYIYDLSRYRRALEQKNRALKLVRERLAPPDSLDVWDAQIADYGGRVCARREKFIRGLARLAAEMYARLSDSAEPLAVSYDPSVPAPEALEEWPRALADALRGRRQEEIARGVSLVGPQRDDLKMDIGGLTARSFASRGQARTAALALRLSQASLAREQTGEWPIVLMDDVFSELDSRRRELLAAVASEAEQVFATAASASDLPDLDAVLAGRVLVERGALRVEGGSDAA